MRTGHEGGEDMSDTKYPVKIHSVTLSSDASDDGSIYKVEYEVIGKAVIGRFFTPADGFDETKLPELIKADLEKMLPAIKQLDLVREAYEGKEIMI